jgi:hypothetical protein
MTLRSGSLRNSNEVGLNDSATAVRVVLLRALRAQRLVPLFHAHPHVGKLYTPHTHTLTSSAKRPFPLSDEGPILVLGMSS